MNYKTAICYNPEKKPLNNITGIDINKLKKGMVLLTKNGVFHTLTEEERSILEKEDFEKRANNGMNEIVNRYLSRLKSELRLENYHEDEINIIIEQLINMDDIVEEEESSDEEEEYYSEDDDYNF
tara:strand:- start:7338 stop:7712 length:375 start_codon:yes stop_codon:yes gene_type:complete